MRTRHLWISVMLGSSVMGCGVAGEAQLGGAATAANPASCEAMVDHQVAECPDGAHRLFDIELCEQNRVEAAPIGCSQALADYVLCQTEAEIDCESGYALGCDDELERMRSCRQQFAIRSSCSRAVTRDARDCDAGRFSFLCIDLATLGKPELPAHCELIHEPGTFCCDSFTGDTLDDSLFVDPVLGPDELPPDYSGVDFTNPAMCLDFSEEQGWGRCEQSSGCACIHCAAELSECAADYGCVVSHRCDRGGSCSPADEPFFTGWGNSDPLVACMEAAGCARSCL